MRRKKKVNKWRGMFFLLAVTSLISCGVKGPPEPPLPTEASLKKQSLVEDPQVKEDDKQPSPLKKPKTKAQ
jgi:predicted small lipoprotein YifL